MNEALITAKDISLSYDGRTVLENVSFTVKPGDYLCIVGENGSGKSTLLKSLLSLKQPDTGSITYAPGLKKHGIGYLPQQNPLQRDFPASVFEVVLSGCLPDMGMRPFFSRREKEKAEANLKRLNISDLKNRSCQELSGGQLQRVLLARALCSASRLLLADEPATGLDMLAACELYGIIASLRGDGISAVTVTHDISEAMEHASHILHLDRTVRFFGTASDYSKTAECRRFLEGGHHGTV